MLCFKGQLQTKYFIVKGVMHDLNLRQNLPIKQQCLNNGFFFTGDFGHAGVNLFFSPNKMCVAHLLNS
jgi:hypothetical protein